MLFHIRDYHVPEFYYTVIKYKQKHIYNANNLLSVHKHAIDNAQNTAFICVKSCYSRPSRKLDSGVNRNCIKIIITNENTS